MNRVPLDPGLATLLEELRRRTQGRSRNDQAVRRAWRGLTMTDRLTAGLTGVPGGHRVLRVAEQANGGSEHEDGPGTPETTGGDGTPFTRDADPDAARALLPTPP